MQHGIYIFLYNNTIAARDIAGSEIHQFDSDSIFHSYPFTSIL